MVDPLKKAAATAAIDYIRDGMKLGIGTGSTADAFVHLLSERINSGMTIVGVPTSERTARLCRELNVPLTTLEDTPRLDLTIDGTDELDANPSLIKGGGGALLREKIVATASDRMIVIADNTKLVETLGAFDLPIEVNRFGLSATRIAIENETRALGLSGNITPRMNGDREFVTDEGHFILDASFGRIPDPQKLSNRLLGIPGVVEHGLFIGIAEIAILAGPGGIQIMTAPQA